MPAFVSEFTHPRVTFEDLPPHRPAGLEARLLAFVQAGYLDSGVTESVRIRRAEAIGEEDDPLDSREAAAGGRDRAVHRSEGEPVRAV